MPETDTPLPDEACAPQDLSRGLAGRMLHKRVWDALRHPHCESAGVRTQDPILKRDVLYRLSY